MKVHLIYFLQALTRQFKPLIKDKPCLRDVVQWLLIQGGSDAAAFREECLRLTSVLAQHVKGKPDNLKL